MVGKFVTSKAGRDKGTLYIVLKEDDGNVYVVDGKYKLVEHPKKKKFKHIQRIVKFEDQYIISKLQEGILPTNEEIKNAIKNYGTYSKL